MFTHSWVIQAGESPSAAIKATPIETGGTQVLLDQNVPASSTNFPIAAAFAAGTLQSFLLIADSDTVIKTNSTGSPGNTWNLKAGRPMEWRKSDGYFTNPVSVDVTSLFATNGASATRFQVKILNT